MRLFIALIPPETVKDAVYAAAEPLRSSGADVKWVERENLHLTLAFLGAVDPPRLAEAEGCLARVCAGRAPFEVSFGAFGSFVGLRVLWLGVERGAAELRGLAEALSGELLPKGLIAEEEARRPFRAHLTLGRQRSPRAAAALRRALESPPPAAAFEAGAISIVESRLSPKGPTYEERARLALAP